MGVPWVYMLGSAPIGRLLSFQLAKAARQPVVPHVVVLLQDANKMGRFLEGQSRLAVHEGDQERQQQFMASCMPPVTSSGEKIGIENMVVAETGQQAFSVGLKKYKASLTAASAVVLVNPRFGLVHHLYKHVWPEAAERPRLYLATGGQQEVWRRGEFGAELRGRPPVRLTVSAVPRELEQYEHAGARQRLEAEVASVGLLQMLGDCCDDPAALVQPVFVTFGAHMLGRLEQLLIAAAVEPVAALYGCSSYGELLGIKEVDRVLRALLAEGIRVIRVAFPFLPTVEGHEAVLNVDVLYKQLLTAVQAKSARRPRMGQSIDELNITPVRTTCGFLTALARQHKLHAPLHFLISSLARGKAELRKNRLFQQIDLEQLDAVRSTTPIAIKEHQSV
ncbi:AGL109Wp [Eremothecium gossypii ATCC 10895]|uniref:AGL109Wp n=1 Tax=Eremothecium gossypii (strain ATCC 10895 / CBS 109.51 / FGSC 9923 / NRRL Y-1056) TaxID=284811 RepID=Q750Q1_EREGS|nr:AGL109Wp [Eremothecium gossypii ATCC 10895]AAS54382.1 AGL109Wp [Eremothecium gossypii ATCC 10895]AEY98709.1 FAGL109Wp [Eremothecium gossypii FDAG1]